MIVFCGDSFCQNDDLPWNWMRQIAAHYNLEHTSLGQDAVSNFDILTQVEHAVSLQPNLIVICLTTTDRVDYDNTLNSSLVPVSHAAMRDFVQSNTLTALYRSQTVTNDMLPFFASIPLNLKKNEIYIQHMINTCRSSGIPFLIFNNIFPVWNNQKYQHWMDYTVDGPASLMTPGDFIHVVGLPAFSETVGEHPIPAQGRSCHLTMQQSVVWTEKVIKYIDTAHENMYTDK